MIRRGLLALLLGACAALGIAATAWGDGDPASDYLVANQVFAATASPRSTADRDLLAAVRAANRSGFAIRVAVIANQYDLGSITALWRRPRAYARFLGLELSGLYKQRLLVVMPNGFGMSWPRHSTTASDRLLAALPVYRGDASLLTAARVAVHRLAAAAGVTVASPSAPSGATADRRAHAGNLRLPVALGVALTLVLVAFALARRRRSHGRMGSLDAADRTPTPPSTTPDTVRLRDRRAAPGLAAVGGFAVLAPIAVLVARHAASHASPVAVSTAAALPAVSWPAGKRPAPEFALHDQDGHAVSLAAYRGRTVIITFVDPLCRNLCPLEAKVINDAIHRLPVGRRPEVLAVSVDVYAHANSRADLLQDDQKWQLVPQWHWAVGPPATLATVWKHYQIGVKVTTRRIADTTIRYITHSEAAYVVDSTGHERALFGWPFYPQDLDRTLRQLT